MESENVIRIFIPPALSQIQAHSYKEHGNEIRKDLAETRVVGRQSQDVHGGVDSHWSVGFERTDL